MSEQLKHDDARALRRLVEELRSASAPELDWDKAESRLLTALETEKRARPPQAVGGEAWSRVGAFAMAAAAVVMLLATQSGRDTTPISPAREMVAIDAANLPAVYERDELPTYQVDKMTPKSVIMSGDEPMRFALAGVATWVLAPHSHVVVQTTSSPHVLELHEGTVAAEVVPRHDSNQLVESFVIEAGTTRVAVHGTVFSVTRDGDELTVDVTRGSVTVGPAGYRGATSGHLLIGPARASFSLHEARLARVHSLLDEAPQPTAALPSQETAQRAPSTSPSERLADDEPAPAPVAAHNEQPRDPGVGATPEPNPSDAAPAVVAPLTGALAHSIVASCLTANAARGEGSGTRLLISSRVTAVPGGDGKVMAVRFSPPLRPDLQERCGGALFGREVAGGANLSFSVNVTPQ